MYRDTRDFARTKRFGAASILGEIFKKYSVLLDMTKRSRYDVVLRY